MRPVYTLFLLLLVCTMANAQTLEELRLDTILSSHSCGVYIPCKNKLFFVGTALGSGDQLWSCDSGQKPLQMTTPNFPQNNFGLTAYKKMAVFNDSIYFCADNGVHGKELFGFDGQHAFLAADINSGSASSTPTDITVLNGKLYFAATTPAEGTELWCYDPAIAHTFYLVKDIILGNTSSNPRELTVLNGKLCFTVTYKNQGTRDLYIYDPATGIDSIIDMMPGGSSDPTDFKVLNNKLYFTANSTAYGRELFSYTGTGMPVLVKDICPGSYPAFNHSTPSGIGVLNSNLVLCARTSYAGPTHLLMMDTSTLAIKEDTFSSYLDADVSGYTNYHGRIFFGAKDSAFNDCFWASDGVNKSVKIAQLGLWNFWPGANIAVFKDWIYFSGVDHITGNNLFRYCDGTTTLQQITFNADIQLYPNPATDQLNIALHLRSPQRLIISLCNEMGQEVFNSELYSFNAGSSSYSISTSLLATGNYFCMLKDEAGRMLYSGKVVKR